MQNDTTHQSGFFNAPVWQVGFRPFFMATCLAGAVLPLLWVFAYSGVMETPAPLFNPFIDPLHWHRHEMFFGFGWALLGGFLLTASKNWVGIRGQHGGTLALLVTLWGVDRLVMAFGGDLPVPVVGGLSFLFITAIIVLLERDLLRHRATDSYRDNIYFILALPLFLVAKAALLTHDADPAIGSSMALGLFRLCFLIMLERTLEAFMKGVFGVQLKRIRWVDHAIKTLACILIFAYWIPPATLGPLSWLLAALLLARWSYWHPGKALRRLDVGVMYLGYLAIIGNLVLQGGHVAWATHVFTLGAMGLIAPAMIVRISNGHTGRKVQFRAMDKLALYLMLMALLFRVGVPLFAPLGYTLWLYVSAACWLLAFGLLGIRYTPMLLGPRIDGRIH